MKYSNQIEINLPVQKVIELFDNQANITKWQAECVSYNHLSGTPGQIGAKTLLKYKMGRREIDMTETIVTKNLPEELSKTYEAKGVFNRVNNSFKAIGEKKTLFNIEQEFLFTNLMMKLMGALMPGAFKNQTKKYLNNFKSFAEHESESNG